MKEIKCDKTRRRRALIKVLGIMVLALLMLVNMAGAAPYAYVTNLDSYSVGVIDTSTNTVTAWVGVGAIPWGIAVNPAGTKVYVTNTQDDTVSVIDTSTNTVTATVTVGEEPHGIAVNPSGTEVYVANRDSDTVSVIDTSTNTVKATVTVGAGPQGVAVNPKGTKVYVTDGNGVSVIDTSTNTVTATVVTATVIEAGDQSQGIVVNQAGTKVYVSNTRDGTVSIIDTSTNTVTATVDVGAGPQGVAINPEGTKVYVASRNSGTVSIIDTSTNTVTATVDAEAYYGVAVTSDGKKVYVVNTGSDAVSVIDTSTNKVIASISVGMFPVGITTPVNQIQEQPVLPVANFITNVTSGYSPLSVQFTSLSQNATSWNWDLGDGATSIEQSPVHTYSAAKTYSINLTVSNSNGTDSKLATINVLKATPTITWSNPADITSGTPLSSIQLNAVASVPGTFTYTLPLGTVLDVGTHTLHVDFTPIDAPNYTTASKDVTINVLEKQVIPAADLSASLTSGKAPLTITFTDRSTGSPTSWSWNFGDKSTSIDQSPVHTYSKAGKYTVSLTVKNEVGSNTKKVSNYITVKK